MNFWDISILVLVGLWVLWVVLRLRRKKKSGCPGCCSCCDGCGAPVGQKASGDSGPDCGAGG